MTAFGFVDFFLFFRTHDHPAINKFEKRVVINEQQVSKNIAFYITLNC